LIKEKFDLISLHAHEQATTLPKRSRLGGG